MSPNEPVDIATQLMREFAALNTATERAHQVLADMRAERKLLEATKAELRALAEQIGKVTSTNAQGLIDHEVNRRFDESLQIVLAEFVKVSGQANAEFAKFAEAVTTQGRSMLGVKP